MAAAPIISTIASSAGSIWDASKAFGSINDEIIVTVRGDVTSKKKDLYFMAAALAFGQTQRWTNTVLDIRI